MTSRTVVLISQTEAGALDASRLSPDGAASGDRGRPHLSVPKWLQNGGAIWYNK